MFLCHFVNIWNKFKQELLVADIQVCVKILVHLHTPDKMLILKTKAIVIVKLTPKSCKMLLQVVKDAKRYKKVVKVAQKMQKVVKVAQ